MMMTHPSHFSLACSSCLALHLCWLGAVNLILLCDQHLHCQHLLTGHYRDICYRSHCIQYWYITLCTPLVLTTPWFLTNWLHVCTTVSCTPLQNRWTVHQVHSTVFIYKQNNMSGHVHCVQLQYHTPVQSLQMYQYRCYSAQVCVPSTGTSTVTTAWRSHQYFTIHVTSYTTVLSCTVLYKQVLIWIPLDRK